MTVDINTILSGLTVVVLAILALLQAGAKRGLERSAELFVNNANWSRELAQQLERARGLGRQEARLDSYGALWKELRTLAIYDTASIDRTAIADLSSRLSDWYFSPKGGLLLTEHVREFHFALQDLLQAAVRYPDAPVDRPPSGEPRERLLAIVRADHLDGAEQTLVALKDLPAREGRPSPRHSARNGAPISAPSPPTGPTSQPPIASWFSNRSAAPCAPRWPTTSKPACPSSRGQSVRATSSTTGSAPSKLTARAISAS